MTKSLNSLKSKLSSKPIIAPKVQKQVNVDFFKKKININDSTIEKIKELK